MVSLRLNTITCDLPGAVLLRPGKLAGYQCDIARGVGSRDRIARLAWSIGTHGEGVPAEEGGAPRGVSAHQRKDFTPEPAPPRTKKLMFSKMKNVMFSCAPKSPCSPAHGKPHVLQNGFFQNLMISKTE
jgi:hypothetical protein